MDERDDEWITAYRQGFVKGYEDGIGDGRFQGFRDAKHLAFQAVKDDLDARELLSKYVGEE